LTGTTISQTANATLVTGNPGSGSVTITGGPDQTATIYPCQLQGLPVSCPTTFQDAGQIQVTVGGFQTTIQYSPGNTVSDLGGSLASALTGSSSPVTVSANGAVVSITAKAWGAGSNYPISIIPTSTVVWVDEHNVQHQVFSSPSFSATDSASTLTWAP
jgi:hypothetical protein